MRIDSQLHLAHRKPTDVLEISYGGPETSREFEGWLKLKEVYTIPRKVS